VAPVSFVDPMTGCEPDHPPSHAGWYWSRGEFVRSLSLRPGDLAAEVNVRKRHLN